MADALDPAQIIVHEVIERVLGIRNPTHQALQHLAPGTVMAFDPSLFTQSGAETSFIHLPGVVSRKLFTASIPIQITPLSAPGLPDDAFLGVKVFVRGTTLSDRYEEVELGLLGNPVSTVQVFDGVTVISKPRTPERVLVEFPGLGGSLILAAHDTSAPIRARVQLMPAPTVRASYLIHGKLRCHGLRFDGDTPQIQGVDNALLAFAQADMLERQRQYAKSQLKLKEAGALIQTLLELERNQTAHEQRIIPFDVHGRMEASQALGTNGKGYW